MSTIIDGQPQGDASVSAHDEATRRYIKWEEEQRARQRQEDDIAIESAEVFPDLADLPVSPHFGGPPSIRDKARADTTVSEATFGGPRNYTQETAERPGGTQ